MPRVSDDIVASAHVKQGRLWIRQRRAFDAQIAQYRDGTELEVCVTRRRAARSLQQNRYWWSVCLGLVSEHTGYTVDELHEIAKQLFLPKRVALVNGTGETQAEVTMGGSTRTLTTDEFTTFIEQWRQWVSEHLDIDIPDPAASGEGAL